MRTYYVQFYNMCKRYIQNPPATVRMEHLQVQALRYMFNYSAMCM